MQETQVSYRYNSAQRKLRIYLSVSVIVLYYDSFRICRHDYVISGRYIILHYTLRLNTQIYFDIQHHFFSPSIAMTIIVFQIQSSCQSINFALCRDVHFHSSEITRILRDFFFSSVSCHYSALCKATVSWFYDISAFLAAGIVLHPFNWGRLAYLQKSIMNYSVQKSIPASSARLNICWRP